MSHRTGTLPVVADENFAATVCARRVDIRAKLMDAALATTSPPVGCCAWARLGKALIEATASVGSRYPRVNKLVFHLTGWNPNERLSLGETAALANHLLSSIFLSKHSMQTPDSNYQLLDFGLGRKLERFGDVTVNRPCPGAANSQGSRELWKQVDFSYGIKREDCWHVHQTDASQSTTANGDWFCDCDGIRMSLKPTPAGQVGVFPEHWSHWPWLVDRLAPHDQTIQSQPRVLSLFAYTGATTLALARAGCAVTHVDASKPTVAWARENCAYSNLERASIRWIVDDAATFVKRELRRNMQYEAIILDPPTYGHGSKGTRWEIHRHLMPLLHDCWQLLSEARKAVLLSGHSSHIAIRDINAELGQKYGAKSVANCEIHQANLIDSFDRKLDCGFAARYSF